MEKLWQQKLRQIDPYVPGEQSQAKNLVKLNANENPYPPSPRASNALRTFDGNTLRFYPSADPTELKNALAAREGLRPSQVFIGNGSDDVLALAFQSFFCSDAPILFPDITYSFYPVWCSLFHIPYQMIPLTPDFSIDSRDYNRNCGGIIFPNPNAPTGICTTLSTIEAMLKHHQDCIIIIDEAYVDFGAESCIKLLSKYENLLVVQTFSKSRSLAGMRIGVAYGNEVLIRTLEAVKNSYNSYPVDVVSIATGVAAVEDEVYFQETCAKIIATRERTVRELSALNFTTLPSSSNFVLATHRSTPASAIFESLRAQNIFIRYFNLPRINQYLRITIGTEEEMDKLFHALKSLLK